MKIKTHKWTLALAAAGIVSLPSVATAQEAAAGADALAASTTLSGYVSTSYTLSDSSGADIGKANENADQFKLDIVSLTLSSAQGAGEYATGYNVGMWIGPDNQHTAAEFQLTQANIDLRLPVGNGLDVKVGYFGTVVGYEVYEYTDNAFFQRGLGFYMEPTHHTGILASYQLTDDLSVAAAVVNNGGDAPNEGDAGGSASDASVAATVSYTAPDSMGFASGTSVYFAAIMDNDPFSGGTDADFYYASVGLPVGVEGLSVDLAADWVDHNGGNDDEIYQIYTSYALSEKSTLNARYEWGTSDANSWTGLESYAVGITYDLWDNVLSRVEYMSTSEDGSEDDETVAFNLIYSF